MGFSHGSVVKNLPANAGDASSIPVSGRSPAEGNGNRLQYSCLQNPMARGSWWATVHGLQKVGHDLVTKQQQKLLVKLDMFSWLLIIFIKCLYIILSCFIVLTIFFLTYLEELLGKSSF